MSNCRHVFMGTVEGVECQKCHKKMTVEEYMELRYGKKGATKNERVPETGNVPENPAE